MVPMEVPCSSTVAIGVLTASLTVAITVEAMVVNPTTVMLTHQHRRLILPQQPVILHTAITLRRILTATTRRPRQLPMPIISSSMHPLQDLIAPVMDIHDAEMTMGCARLCSPLSFDLNI